MASAMRKGIKLGIESLRHGEDAVRGGIIDNLGILEHVDAKAEARSLWKTLGYVAHCLFPYKE